MGAKEVRLVRLTDSLTRDWLETADVISEGRVDSDGALSRYFGSTSIVIVEDKSAGLTPDALMHLIGGDPHLRLRMVRLARREALVRAMRPLGTLAIELSFSRSRSGVAITIDVCAIVVVDKLALAY